MYQREVDVDMLNAVKSVLAKIQDFYAEKNAVIFFRCTSMIQPVSESNILLLGLELSFLTSLLPQICDCNVQIQHTLYGVQHIHINHTLYIFTATLT